MGDQKAMELNFESFANPRPVMPPNKMRASIAPHGDFYLNRAVVEALGWPEAVTMMYDRGQNIIGIKPADPEDGGGYPLRPKGGRSRSRNVFAGSFCRHFRIAPPGTLNFRAPRLDKGGVLLLDLNDVVPCTGRSRRSGEER